MKGLGRVSLARLFRGTFTREEGASIKNKHTEDCKPKKGRRKQGQKHWKKKLSNKEQCKKGKSFLAKKNGMEATGFQTKGVCCKGTKPHSGGKRSHPIKQGVHTKPVKQTRKHKKPKPKEGVQESTSTSWWRARKHGITLQCKKKKIRDILFRALEKPKEPMVGENGPRETKPKVAGPKKFRGGEAKSKDGEKKTEEKEETIKKNQRGGVPNRDRGSTGGPEGQGRPHKRPKPNVGTSA